jgi:hypothetical protein
MNESSLVDNNIPVRRCREIVVNSELGGMQEIIDFATRYALQSRLEMNEGMIEGNESKMVLANYHLKCLCEIMKCMDRLNQKINGIEPVGAYNWGFNK